MLDLERFTNECRVQKESILALTDAGEPESPATTAKGLGLESEEMEAIEKLANQLAASLLRYALEKGLKSGNVEDAGDAITVAMFGNLVTAYRIGLADAKVGE